jgi:hypothetical protein
LVVVTVIITISTAAAVVGAATVVCLEEQGHPGSYSSATAYHRLLVLLPVVLVLEMERQEQPLRALFSPAAATTSL